MTPNDLPPSFQRSSLEGKVAVVTGSTQGLGEATARLFRERGCRGLVITGRNKDRGKRLAKELTSESCKVVFVKADLENIDDVRNILKATDTAFGTLDILVNAAATTDRGSLWDTTPDDYDRIMNTNARAPFFLMQDAARIMEREKIAGSIINISSTASYGSLPMLAAYGMSKGALNVATKNAAYSLMWSKIRVNALAIGWMDTPGEDAIQRKLHSEGSTGDHWKAIGEASQPFGRLLQPDEVARCIAFCASEESGMMTGCVIDFDQSVWGAGNAPVPPQQEEWAKANGMTFSFEAKTKSSPQVPLPEITPWTTPKNNKKKKVSKPKTTAATTTTTVPSPSPLRTQKDEDDSTSASSETPKSSPVKGESKSLSATPKSSATPKTTSKRSPKSTADMPIIPLLTSSPQKSPAVTKSRTKAGASPVAGRRKKKEDKSISEAAVNEKEMPIKSRSFHSSPMSPKHPALRKQNSVNKHIGHSTTTTTAPTIPSTQKFPSAAKKRTKTGASPIANRKKREDKPTSAVSNASDETIKTGTFSFSKKKKKENTPVVEAVDEEDGLIKSLASPTSRRKKKIADAIEAAVNVEDETIKTGSSPISRRKKIEDKPAKAATNEEDGLIKSLSSPTSRRKKKMRKPAEAENEEDETVKTGSFSFSKRKKEEEKIKNTPAEAVSTSRRKKEEGKSAEAANEKDKDKTKDAETTLPVSPKPMAVKKQNSADKPPKKKKQDKPVETATRKEETKQTEGTPPVSPKPMALKKQNSVGKQISHFEEANEKDDTKQTDTTPPVSLKPMALKKQNSVNKQIAHFEAAKESETTPPVSRKPMALKKQNSIDKQIAHFEAANEKEDTKQIEFTPPVSPNPTALKNSNDAFYKKKKQDKPTEASAEKDDAKEIEFTPPASPNPMALEDPEDKPYKKKKQDKPAEAAAEKEETKQTEANPPVSLKPTASKKQNSADKPYPDEDRSDPAEFIRMLRMEEAGAQIEMDTYLPGTDPFAGAQERKDRAKLKYGGNSAPSSPSPKSPKQTRFDPPNPDDENPLVTGVRKLQDVGEKLRPDEYFSGNDPCAKKQERVKKFGSNSDRDYRAAKVDEWLGGSGKTQRRSYRVKKVRDLMSEETAEE